MGGCRSFTDKEIQGILDACEAIFNKKTGLRNKAFVKLGIYTGFRVSELLSIRVKWVMPYPGVMSDRVEVPAAFMKSSKTKTGKVIRRSRSVKFHPDAAETVREWIEHAELEPNDYLFKSQQGKKAISRMQAWRIYEKLAKHMHMLGKLGTHSARKTFAMILYRIFDKDIIKVQIALGHRQTDTTRQYLDVGLDDVDEGILQMPSADI